VKKKKPERKFANVEESEEKSWFKSKRGVEERALD